MQHLGRQQLSTFIGASGGRYASARPWYDRGTLASQNIGALEDLAYGSSKPWDEDYFDLDSDGAQTVELTYLPLDRSLKVFLNGLFLRKGTEWTRDGKTLSILSAAGALTDDVLGTHYWYLEGLADVPTEELFELNVPYGSSGWRYLNDYIPANAPAATSYNDSSWALGTGVLHHTGATTPYTAPFTDGTTLTVGSEEGLGTDVGAAVPEGGLGIEGTLWIRRWFPPGEDIYIKVDGNNYWEAFIDGVSVGSRSTAARAASTFGPYDKTSTWLLAVRVNAGAGQTWAAVDIEVEGTPT